MSWYVMDKDGDALLCNNEVNARRRARYCDLAFAGDAPHRAAQLVEYVEPELTRLSVACDVQTLCANGDLPDSMEVLADWIAAGEMPEAADGVRGYVKKIESLIQERDEWKALAQPAPVQEPVAAQCKFDREMKWLWCEIAHHNLVQSEPHHWPGYQTRLLYTTPPAQPAEPLMDGVFVPLVILEAAEASLGSFCNEYGWSDKDMQSMDNLSAHIARHKANRGITKGEA
jgi:hypothetical protein